jgi:hypothetical protein
MRKRHLRHFVRIVRLLCALTLSAKRPLDLALAMAPR